MEIKALKRRTPRILFLYLMFIYFCITGMKSVAGVPEEKLIFLSDTQEPLWFERIVLSGNNNIKAGNMILDRIIAEEPAAVFHAGDLVALGYHQESWHRIDKFLHALASRNIPFFPTLGNHEIFLFTDTGFDAFMNRFPEYSPTGYMVKIGSVAVLMLNSNFGYPDEKQISEQQIWYRSMMDSCERDPGIAAILVACHHSSYTNSKIVSPNAEVRNYLLPDFIRSSKSKLFISGHAHTFEHFFEQGKDFLVIGGGGGLQHPVAKGKQAEYNDKFNGPEKRPFHYLRIMLYDGSMTATLCMVDDDFQDFRIGYQLDLAY